MTASETRQASWSAPKAKGGCRRDPNAGPGSCWYWWEGCPDAEKRECYVAWAREQAGVLL